jgi:hypothetical protein
VKSFPAFGILFGARERVRELSLFLQKNSGLPGPRANLELAHAFATAVADMHLNDWQWQWLVDTASMSPTKAPVNDPKEYLPFCATLAMGALYGAGLPRPRKRAALAALREAAVDPRWRMREGAAQGLQRAGETDLESMRAVIDQWIDDPDPLMLRAVAAALAHPPVLKDEAFAAYAVGIGEKLVAALTRVPAPARKKEDFKILRQGLGYALSVFVAAAPEAGFTLLHRAAAVRDADLAIVVKENLKKQRIAAAFPRECAEVAAIAGRAAAG